MDLHPLPTTTVIRCGRCSDLFADRPAYDAHRLDPGSGAPVGSIAALPPSARQARPQRRDCLTIDQRFAAGWFRDPFGLWHVSTDIPRDGSDIRTPRWLTLPLDS